jgi:phage gp36-like protein
MPQTEYGFTFAMPNDAVKILTASEVVLQSELDEPSNEAIDPDVWLPCLVSNASLMLGYIGHYPLDTIDGLALLKKINVWLANWDLEIYGIRDAQERRYKLALKWLEQIKDNTLLLYDADGHAIALLPASETARVDGVDYGYSEDNLRLSAAAHGFGEMGLSARVDRNANL